jgi:hypothetical protein
MAVETEKILLDVEFDETLVQSAITAIQGYRNQIDTLKTSQQELIAQGQQNSAQYIKQEAELKTLSNQVRQNQRVVEANSSAQRKQQGYVESLKKSIIELTVQYDRLTKEELENEAIGGKLQKQIKAQSDELKKLKSNIGDNRLEVGNYKEGIIEATKQIQIGGINVGNTLKDIDEINDKFFQTMVTGFKESGLQAKLFGNALRTTLTVTGIGLFLVALGTIVAYWDDILQAIGLAESAQEKFFRQQQENIEKSRMLLEQYNAELEAQNRILEIQGDKERELFANRRKAILFDIALAERSRNLAKARIESFIQENNLTEENIRLKRQAARAFGQGDPFAPDSETMKKLAELKKAYDDQIIVITNLRNQLAVLDQQEKKFTDDTAKREAEELKAAKKFAEEVSKALPTEQSKTRKAAQDKEIKDREEFQFKITDGLHKYADVQLGIERVVADRKEQIWLKNAKEYNASNQAKVESDKAYIDFTKYSLRALAGLFDQGTATNKAFALGSIAVDTAQAISSLTARSEQNPANAVTFGAAGIAQYAAGIIRILSNIAQAKQLLNFALGGLIEPMQHLAGGGFVRGVRKSFLLGGRPHSQGGTKFFGTDGTRFEAERGEALVVVNKRDTPMLKSLNAVNSRHGRNFLADGGFVRRNINSQVTQSIDSNAFSGNLAKAMEKVNIILKVQELERVQKQSLKTKVTSELRRSGT